MSATIVTSSSTAGGGSSASVGRGILRHASSPPLPSTSETSSSSQTTATSNLESLSGFVNKPARGWLHPDHLFAKDGINYNVRVSTLSSHLIRR